MSLRWSKKRLILLCGLFVAFTFLFSCNSNNGPIVLSDEIPVDGSDGSNGNGGNGHNGPCQVQFKALIQLKASANPKGASGPFEILDANPFSISEPIPIIVEGNRVILEGNTFPDIFFRPPETPADVKIAAVPDSRSIGTYNSDTGEMRFPKFGLFLEIVQKGTDIPFIEGEKVLPLVNLTTGTITVNGNLNSIKEEGAPLNKEDKSLVLVTGLTMPTDFDPLTPLNTIIGGGALTARFEGILDQLPETCGDGDGGFPEPFDPIPGIKIEIENQTLIKKIDFGTSIVITKRIKGKTELNCSETINRDLLSRKVTLTNTGTETRQIRLKQPKDLDKDLPSPLCGGSSEFVRGTLTTTGSAECESFEVGGKKFSSGECTLPPGAENSISFPLMYLPFNFQEPQNGGELPVDKGEFIIFADNNGNGPFAMKLFGRAKKDDSDLFSISKLIGEDISNKSIKNKGLLKIAINEEDPNPFVQPMVLRNAGTDSFEDITFKLEGAKNFSVEVVGDPVLPPMDEEGEGLLQFNITFKPGSEIFYNDTLVIRLVKAGSVTSENPTGEISRIEISILGTVGIPPIKGRWKLYFDFFTALVDHVALTEPLESSDFRARPDLAPAPYSFVFNDTAVEGVQEVLMEYDEVDLLDPLLTVEDRKKILRIFNARASRRADGQPFTPSDTEDSCQEPTSILKPYQAGDCSYFYFTVTDFEKGIYDDDTGHLTLPSISMRMANPYHADIFGIWPESNPNLSPDYVLDVPMVISFTTHLLDRRTLEEPVGNILNLVPDERILESDLIIRDKRLGKECEEGYLEGVFPHLRCYLSADEKFLQGRSASLRPNLTNQYEVIMVGVTRLPPGSTDPDIPWFLGDNGGSLLYIAFQGRLCPEDDPCDF